jgi:hypothetical protein
MDTIKPTGVNNSEYVFEVIAPNAARIWPLECFASIDYKAYKVRPRFEGFTGFVALLLKE